MHGVYYGYTQLAIMKFKEREKKNLSVSSGNALIAK